MTDEPEPRTDHPLVGGPSRARIFWRGLTARCPICGSAKIVRRYFSLVPRCPRCGLRFSRLEGHWSGDIGINTIVTFSLLYGVLLGGTLAMWGDVNIAALAITAGVVTVVFPIAFIPVAKTLWTAIDCMMRPVSADEIDPDYRRTLAPTAGSTGRPGHP